jgi:exodeoxyribonuclease VII small subunit
VPTSTTPTPDVPEVATLGYEQARDELVAVVARLEAGADSLEESLTLWERGEALAARCQEWLDGARVRLETARAAQDGPQAPGASDVSDAEDEA